MRIQHSCLVNLIFIFCCSCFNRKKLYIDVGHIHGCKLYRKSSQSAWIYTVGIDHTRNLYAGICRKIFNQSIVQYISADFIRNTGNNGFHNVRSIFFGTLMSDFAVFQNIFSFFFPTINLIDTATWILVQRNVVFIDHFRIFGFDEQRVVLSIVFTGFCTIISQMFDVLETNHIIMFLFRIHFCCTFTDFRIEIISFFIIEFQKPSHMIDSGNRLPSAFQLVLHTQFFQQILRANLYTVAKTYGADFCISLHISCQHSHRISIVQKQCIRTNFFHITGKFFQHRNGTKCSHNSADSQGICDCLAKTIFLRNLKIGHGTWFITAYLNGIHNKIRIPKRIFSVLHTKICMNHCTSFIDIPVNGTQNNLRVIQTFLVNIIQCNLRFPKSRCTHTVSQNISCKHCAARTHKSNFHL